MKLNGLKEKLKGVSLQNKVEGSIVKLVPVDKTARLVVQPRPWWADPVPDSKTKEYYESECNRLSDLLSRERKEHGGQIRAASKRISELKASLEKSNLTISELKSINASIEKEKEALRSEIKRISRIFVS